MEVKPQKYIYVLIITYGAKKKMEKEQKYYYGNAISDYGMEHGYVDYATLAKCFDAVLNNDIMSLTYDIGLWEQVSGIIDNTDELEVFQWFIVDDWGARLLQQETNEIVYYNETLDMYLWGVTHYGTSWNYVLTNIEIDW
jgi:hypothetical protein